jgi:acyl-coenzyme A thioesterase PaaI-like protein
MALTDEQIRALLRDPAKHPPCARHLGFELIDFSVDGGWAEVAFSPRAEFASPAGQVQSGFVCAMLDDAMSVAASVSRRFAVIVPTLQTTVSYLSPTPMARVIPPLWVPDTSLRDVPG